MIARFVMKKICGLIIFALISCVFLSACDTKTNNSLIKSQRKLAKYLEPQKTPGTVDLSEGPKLKYDAYFGPKKLNFDFKIENPY